MTSARPSFMIGHHEVGGDARCFVIAELSANHGQDLARALALVDAAKEAGADAVKLQTYTADTITLDSDAPIFRIKGGTLWDGATLHTLYQQAYTPWEWHAQLKERAEALGMECFSSPFDDTAVDYLEQLHVPAYKVASFELVDLPLIRKVARTGRPIVMSTGMASLDEIDEAVATARDAGARDLALLVCSSSYPSPPDLIHLRRLGHLRDRYDLIVGLSDHTAGVAVPVAAVALGAKIIEKHFILSRSDGGPDAAFSLEPAEFKEMIEAVRIAERALGSVTYAQEAESSSRAFRRSLFVVEDVAAGELFTPKNVRSIRPAGGLHTRHLDDVLGHPARVAVSRGTPLSWDLVDTAAPSSIDKVASGDRNAEIAKPK
jgi:pseudaminic acid synthase